MTKPTIPIGDIVEQSRLPGWIRWLFGLFRGVKIGAGPVDIQLEENQGIPPARTGLDQPHRTAPPTNWGPRR